MKSVMSSSVFALLLLKLLIAIATIDTNFCNGSSYIGCVETEREALLRFKEDIEDPSNKLVSWTVTDKDCCRWVGVVCSNFTGNVHRLELGNHFTDYFTNSFHTTYKDYESSMLIGKINPSLLDLKHLLYLDLSGNDFSANHGIPSFLGSMTNLRYLNLSFCQFDGGLIPSQLGNLSNLQYLDLQSTIYWKMLYVENLNWVSGLSLLKHLDLSSVNLSKALLDINRFPHLVVLKLSFCQLPRFPLLLGFNLTSVATLELVGNNFEGPIPEVLQNLTFLRHLDLSFNNFNSSIPNWFSKSFSHLEYLSLSYNKLRGMTLGNIENLTSLQNLDFSYNSKIEEKIPRSWKRLCNLKSISLSYVNLSQEISEILDIFSGCISIGLESLDLRETQLFGHLTNQLGKLKNVHVLCFHNNSISGSIPVSLGELSFLKCFDFSDNQLNGTLSEIHLFNLSRLEIFDISENSLKLKVSRDWIPPFQLSELRLRSCNLGPEFPPWLSSQKYLKGIDMSNSKIDDRVPNWLWKFSSLYYLNLSHNQIYGIISNLTISFSMFDLSLNNFLDLSWNNFSGSLPFISSNVSISLLDLSNNAFSGFVFHFFCIDTKEPMNIDILHLQNNLLSGELPDCWSKWKNLKVLNLGNNEFIGNLPTSMKTLSSLWSLHLQGNKFSGRISISLKNCTNLQVLDLGENEFIGNIPAWIGESLLWLKILNLRSNNFDGVLPLELCHLGQLQILNLFANNLSGTIPRCISNFSVMVTANNFGLNHYVYYTYPIKPILENALLVMKGQAIEYTTNLFLVKSVDLSANNFSGEIPIELTNLRGLQSLNLSQNSFTGKIPKSIGAMKSLESLDFSSNQLFGKIPQSLSNLTFLSHLNLSNNKLIGEIPLSTQLQTFDSSCFMGNKLCGPPLEKCSVKMPKNDNENGGGDDDNSKHEVDWEKWGVYISMAIGFVLGFWGVLFPLFVSRRWRGTYYRFLNNLWDKFYVVVMRKCH